MRIQQRGGVVRAIHAAEVLVDAVVDDASLTLLRNSADDGLTVT